MDDGVGSLEQISFGSFRLYPARQLLLDGEKPVPLGSRARDILIALLEKPGQLIGKEELIARVWPNTFVEDGNLKVHVAALRKALGDGHAGNRYITNVPGRGYSFVAPIARLQRQESATRTPVPDEKPQDLPPPLARMVGRSEVTANLTDHLFEHRFVTIVGPGGIGKTAVALAIANASIGAFKGRVCFVDLAPIDDPALVPSALAAAVGIAVRSEDPTRSLVAYLRDKDVLLVLDSCERLIEAVAFLAERVFKGAPSAHILATSREPLGVAGERLYRLPPLASPLVSERITAAEALTFPAVQLFVERAAASLDAFELSDAEAPVVADICRRLDGIALAIEIAAGRTDAFGVAGLAALLDDRFRLVMRGRRTALTRHQTLATTLDWSYAALPETERAALRRLAVFRGIFTMESATAMLARDGLSTASAVDCVANLIAKSLVSAAIDGRVAYYRLLDTTRAYAFGKLTESGEGEAFARIHASHFKDLLEKSSLEWEVRSATEWLDSHRHLIDDSRSALDWAFSANGDAPLGIALTVAAEPLWYQLSLMTEYGERVERALQALEAHPDTHHEMVLQAALGWSTMQTLGSVPKTAAAWSAALNASERLDDVDYELRSLWGLWAGLLNKSDLSGALALAEKFCSLASRSSQAADLLVGDRMVGYILHLRGEQAAARRRIERMLSMYASPTSGSQMIRFVFDQRATARCFLSRILWLQGFPDQAMAEVDDVVGEALQGTDVLSRCQILVQAGCPVSLLVGDMDRLQRFVEELLEQSARNSLNFWRAWGRCFKGVLAIRRGHSAAGLTLLRAALGELRNIQYGVYYVVFLGEFADASGSSGNLAEGLIAIDEALDRAERNEELWYFPELLRIKSDLVLREGLSHSVSDAENYLRKSLDLARAQQTLSWELRSALSLCRLWRSQGRISEALELLAPIFGQFTEGFATGDLLAAKALLDDLNRKHR
jgi:predicted ATPase/DNA-binding winged helix-turn-helix (wHTH) protein